MVTELGIRNWQRHLAVGQINHRHARRRTVVTKYDARHRERNIIFEGMSLSPCPSNISYSFTPDPSPRWPGGSQALSYL